MKPLLTLNSSLELSQIHEFLWVCKCGHCLSLQKEGNCAANRLVESKQFVRICFSNTLPYFQCLKNNNKYVCSQLDMVLEVNAAAVRILDTAYKKLCQMSSEEAAKFRFEEYMSPFSPTIYQRAIARY